MIVKIVYTFGSHVYIFTKMLGDIYPMSISFLCDLMLPLRSRLLPATLYLLSRSAVAAAACSEGEEDDGSHVAHFDCLEILLLQVCVLHATATLLLISSLTHISTMH